MRDETIACVGCEPPCLECSDGLLHNDDYSTHHWTPKREGRLGNEWTYIQHCEPCGAQYRNGMVVWL